MTKRQVWQAAFLGATGLAVGMELWAVLDGSDDTEPWTALIVEHVPPEWTAAAVGGLSVWLGVHFYRAYRKREGKRS